VNHVVTKTQLLLVLALACPVAACRPAKVPDEPTPVPAPAPRDPDAPPGLREIADAIDPGPRPALTVDVPAWLATALRLPTEGGDPQALLAEARAEWERFTAPSTAKGDAATLERVVPLARALALAERAGGNVEEAPVEALLVLERVYDALDAPMLANDQNLFVRMIRMYVATLAQQGQVEGSTALEELGWLAIGVLQKSGELHRRTAAAILRKAPGHRDVPDVLGRIAPELMKTDPALAVGVQRRSLALRGQAATAAHWLDLAGLCSRALDVPCADDALAKAEALGPGDDEKLRSRFGEVRAQAEHARRAVELQDAPGLDDALARGAALTKLQRYADARALYEPLMRRHPDDARPVVGMARVVLEDGFDFVAAAEVLERARPREHLDREWYELSIGVRATALMYHVLPQVMDREPAEILELLRPTFVQLKQDIDGLEALGEEDGRVLRWIYEMAMEAALRLDGDDTTKLRDWLRGMLPRVQALRAEAPGSAYAYALLLGSAELSADRAGALAVIDVAPPEQHAAALAVRRAQAAFDMVTAWDAVERVDAMLALVDAVGQAPYPLAARRLAVDGQVLAGRLGVAVEASAAPESRYRALLGEEGGETDAVLHNNLAAVVADQGRFDEALALWAKAHELAEEDARDIPRLNMAATRAAAALARKVEVPAADRDELRALAESGTPVEVRLQAHAWLVAIAAKPERRKAEKALRDAATKEAKEYFRPRHLPGKGGVILRNSFQVGLGYSTVQGLQIQLDLSGVPWMVLPCPVAVPPAPGKAR